MWLNWLLLPSLQVGTALQDIFAEGVVGRGDLWVTSKLWNSAHGKDQVLPALRKTLQDLQVRVCLYCG
jgi:alcohol dehydrogenase (NADP+)